MQPTTKERLESQVRIEDFVNKYSKLVETRKDHTNFNNISIFNTILNYFNIHEIYRLLLSKPDNFFDPTSNTCYNFYEKYKIELLSSILDNHFINISVPNVYNDKLSFIKIDEENYVDGKLFYTDIKNDIVIDLSEQHRVPKRTKRSTYYEYKDNIILHKPIECELFNIHGYIFNRDSIVYNVNLSIYVEINNILYIVNNSYKRKVNIDPNLTIQENIEKDIEFQNEK